MNRRVLAIVPDLFFATKIAATAVAAGTTLEQVPAALALEHCRTAPPELVLIDLAAGATAIDVARALKSDERTRAVPIVGFYSHIDGATRTAALAAGIDQVLPRSAFVARLPELMRAP